MPKYNVHEDGVGVVVITDVLAMVFMMTALVLLACDVTITDVVTSQTQNVEAKAHAYTKYESKYPKSCLFIIHRVPHQIFVPLLHALPCRTNQLVLSTQLTLMRRSFLSFYHSFRFVFAIYHEVCIAREVSKVIDSESSLPLILVFSSSNTN